MSAITIEYDFEKAAGLVARGNDLELAAAKTKIPLKNLKEYTRDYAIEWNRTIKHERGLMLGQAGAEALTILRNLIRNGEEKSQVASATILMKFWMTMLRHDKGDKGSNAFEVLGGEYYHKILSIEEAEEKLAAEQEAELAAKNTPTPEIAILVSESTIETPSVLPEPVETEVEDRTKPTSGTEIAVAAPSVPEKPVRLDEAEICPYLNQNSSGLLADERYESRPLSHDRGGGQHW